jgi:hypothetical protein
MFDVQSAIGRNFYTGGKLMRNNRVTYFMNSENEITVNDYLLSLCLLLAKYTLGITDEWVAFNITVYLLANAFFVLFDIALTTFISYYLRKIRVKLKINL